MNKTIKEQLEKMENRLNEALDNDLFYDPEYERSVMFPNGEDGEEDDLAF